MHLFPASSFVSLSLSLPHVPVALYPRLNPYSLAGEQPLSSRQRTIYEYIFKFKKKRRPSEFAYTADECLKKDTTQTKPKNIHMAPDKMVNGSITTTTTTSTSAFLPPTINSRAAMPTCGWECALFACVWYGRRLVLDGFVFIAAQHARILYRHKSAQIGDTA